MERIGPYRLESRLGSGGMGEVWKAWDERLKRRVALKRIQPDRDPLARERFRREAEAGARLSHPAIVQVYDILEEPTGDWLVMELVEGGTLGSRLARGPVSLREVLPLGPGDRRRAGRSPPPGDPAPRPQGRQRDADGGRPRQNRRFRPRQALRHGRDRTVLSSTGALVGTVHAMSPEQVLGLALDGRSDLFSFGILLFEMVVGRKPFWGDSPFETMHKICHEPPGPPWPSAGWPPALLELVRRLLNKDPAARPRVGRRGGGRAGGPRRPWRPRRPPAPASPAHSKPGPGRTPACRRARPRPSCRPPGSRPCRPPRPPSPSARWRPAPRRSRARPCGWRSGAVTS